MNQLPKLLQRDGCKIISNSSSSASNVTLIFSHGLGDSSMGFYDLFLNLKDMLNLKRIIIPNAKIRPITCNMGMQMRGWYDIVSLGADRNINNDDLDGIKESYQEFKELISYEIKNHSKSIILGGFSQGAAISLYTALHQSFESHSLSSVNPILGVISCSGYLLDVTNSLKYGGYQIQSNEKVKFPKIMTYHGIDDPVVPIEWANKGYDMLKTTYTNLDLSISKENYLQHSISQQELDQMVQFIKKVSN